MPEFSGILTIRREYNELTQYYSYSATVGIEGIINKEVEEGAIVPFDEFEKELGSQILQALKDKVAAFEGFEVVYNS